MTEYIPYRDIPSRLPIQRGDLLYVSSDILDLAKVCRANGQRFDCAAFITALQKSVGAEGTLLFPTFTWDFCSGKPFDYRKTRGKTGALGNTALTMPGFVRTRHPLYSFAVWGRDAAILQALENTESFGADSPFGYLHRNRGKNLLIGVDMQQAFTFTHYVEQQEQAPYRYHKNFTAPYISEAGEETRTYSMYVRDLERNVTVILDPMERELIGESIAHPNEVNGICCLTIDLPQAYDTIARDIQYNQARKICRYDGSRG